MILLFNLFDIFLEFSSIPWDGPEDDKMDKHLAFNCSAVVHTIIRLGYFVWFFLMLLNIHFPVPDW